MKFANINNNSNNGKVSGGKAQFLGVALKCGSYVAYCGGTYQPGVVTSPKADCDLAQYADDNANGLAALNSLIEEQYLTSEATTATIYANRWVMPGKRFGVVYNAVVGKGKLYAGNPATRDQFWDQICNMRNSNNGEEFMSEEFKLEFIRFFDNLQLIVNAGRTIKIEDYKTLTGWQVKPIESSSDDTDKVSLLDDDSATTTAAIPEGYYVVIPSAERNDFTSTLYAWDEDRDCLGNAVGTIPTKFWQPVGKDDYMMSYVYRSKDGERAYLRRPVYDADLNAHWASDILAAAIKDVNYTKANGFRTPTMPPNQRLINAIEMVALISACCKSVADGGNDMSEAEATLRNK